MEKRILDRKPINLKAEIVERIQLRTSLSIYDAFCRIEIDYNKPLQIEAIAFHSDDPSKKISVTLKLTMSITYFDFVIKELFQNDALLTFDNIELKSSTDLICAFSVFLNHLDLE